MFHQDDGIAFLAQPEQRLDQGVYLRRVQAARRLIHQQSQGGQPASQQACQAHTLHLAGRERACHPIQVQIAQPYLGQKMQAFHDLVQAVPDGQPLPCGQGQVLQDFPKLREAHLAQLVDIVSLQGDSQVLFAQPGSLALRAGPGIGIRPTHIPIPDKTIETGESALVAVGAPRARMDGHIQQFRAAK